MADEAVLRQVGEQVRRRRLERGWTLDAAAPRLGVSRRLLVQIEAGEANPSLSTLLALATGFGVAVVDLLTEAETPSIAIQRDRRSAPSLWSGPSGGAGRLLVASGGLELWHWSLEPGESRISAAHRPGSREALSVTEGVLTVAVGDDSATIGRGQSAAFAAEVEHRYSNEGARTASFFMAVHEPF